MYVIQFANLQLRWQRGYSLRPNMSLCLARKVERCDLSVREGALGGLSGTSA
jgi:hypothetical protein